MLTVQASGITYHRFKNLSGYADLVHGVFGRRGGISLRPFSSLNASYAVDDEPEAVTANRKLICQTMEMPFEALALTKQVHGTNVITIDENGPLPHSSAKRTSEGPVAQPEQARNLLVPADAMISKAHRRLLLMTFADCVPLLFYDPINRAIGLAHGGWRGTVANVAERAVEAMVRHFNSSPEKLLAAIGPAIGPCCYEVGEDVATTVRQSFSYASDLLQPAPGGRVHFNLWETNRRQMLGVGLRAEQIEVAGICTSCNTQEFFSHRAEGGRTGRFAVVLGLR